MKKTLNKMADLGEYEKHLTPYERKKLDLVHQVLNNHSNFSEERNNIRNLIVTYEKLLCKNDVTLSNSLNKSVEALKDQNKTIQCLSELQLNNSKSFLIMPLMSYDHVFSSVWRKIDEGFSAIIVNKGGRPFSSQFIEYHMDEYHANKLINHLVSSFGQKSIPSIYQDFSKNSAFTYKLNIMSKDQKVGNCFIKEPENAIKFSFATKNFTKQDFENLRQGKSQFYSKWDALTVDMHKAFITQIALENPNLQTILSNEYSLYSKNKKFREEIESGKSVEDSLMSAFNKIDISELNKDTLSRRNIASKIKTYFKEDVHKTTALNNILRFNNANFNTQRYVNNPQEAVDTLERLGKDFPNAIRQIKFEAQSAFFSNACYCLNMNKTNKIFGEKALNCINTAINLYPYYFNTHATKGVYYMDVEKDYDKAVESFSNALELQEQANVYYLRDLAYKKLGKLELADEDMSNAKHLQPSRYKAWENMSNLDIVLDYFACPEKFKKFSNETVMLMENKPKIKIEGMTI